MLRFILESVIFFAVLSVSALPLKHVAKLAKRPFNQKRWLQAAGFVAVLSAGLGWSSRDLQRGCRAERNEGCIDIGGVGTQTLLIGGFVVFALVSAYLTYND